MYYQMEILNQENYDKLLTESQGYRSFESSTNDRKLVYRRFDDTWYIQVKSGDLLRVRNQEAQEWHSQVKTKDEK